MKRVLFALAVLASAGAAHAQLAMPSTPAPPASQDAEVLKAWADANVVPAGWEIAARSPTNLLMTPKDFVRRDGKVRTAVRVERYSPQAQGAGFAWRSQLQGLEFDCVEGSARILNVTLFPGQNLQGPWRREDVREEGLVGQAGLGPMSAVLKRACESSRTAYPDVGQVLIKPSRPDSFRWLAESVDEGDWRLLGATPDGAIYLQPQPNLPDGKRQGLMRTEFFSPQPDGRGGAYRSEVATVDVDCAAATTRVSKGARFPAQNLTGAGVSSNTPDPFAKPPSGSVFAVIARDACAPAPAAGPPRPAPAATGATPPAPAAPALRPPSAATPTPAPKTP